MTRVIDGRFKLGERLGGGGMGLVWRARDLELHREVALKEVRPPDPLLLEGDPDAARMLRERVLREARSLARLQHPNVVTIHHIVTSAEVAHPWLVMELVRGGSLQDRLDQGPLTPPEAATLGRGVLAALRAAHAEGILHRDVKPANVLLRPDGTPVLTDFGIAALRESATLTATGDLIGSPEYIAPERIRGREGDPSSDLWSLGMLLYVAVEGRHPLRRGTALATLAAVLDEPIPTPRRAGTLHGVLEALLDRAPEQRPDAARLDELLASAATVGAGLGGPGGTVSDARASSAEVNSRAETVTSGPRPAAGPAGPDESALRASPSNAGQAGSRAHPPADAGTGAGGGGGGGTSAGAGTGDAGSVGSPADQAPPEDAIPTGFHAVPPGGQAAGHAAGQAAGHAAGHAADPSYRPGSERARQRRGRMRVGAFVAAPVITIGALVAFLVLPGLIGGSDGGTSMSPTVGPTASPTLSDSTPSSPGTTTSAPAAEDAVRFKGPFYTERGAKEAVRVLRKTTGGTKVTRASFHEAHLSADCPLTDDPKRYDSLSYHPSNSAEATARPGGMITGETVDLASVNWSALPGLWRRAEQELNVDKPKNRYLIVDHSRIGDGLELRLYLSDEYGGGYLSANADGKVTRTNPR